MCSFHHEFDLFVLELTNKYSMWGRCVQIQSKKPWRTLHLIKTLMCSNFWKEIFMKNECMQRASKVLTYSLELPPSFILGGFKRVKPLMWVPHLTNSKLCIYLYNILGWCCLVVVVLLGGKEVRVSTPFIKSCYEVIF
jgi:hypothetical protein